MEYPDKPYETEPAKADRAHDAGHHLHLSGWPLFVAIVAAVSLVSIFLWGRFHLTGTGNEAIPGALSMVGVLLLLFGVYGWAREDHAHWPHGENPLTEHTQGVKNNAWWGIVMFLATEVMLFGGLFAVWFQARVNGDYAAFQGIAADVFAPTLINTVILVASGVVMHMGEMALLNNNRKGFVFGFAGAILLGLVFLFFQVQEYLHLIEIGFTIQNGVVATSFFALTGTHGLHVLAGVIFLVVIMVRGAKGHFTPERHRGVTSAAYYWHFVDFVWIVVFFALYAAPTMGWF
ncbi:MAG: heme-copper oxidase subunit III [Euryarchaeota archaeon]|nr:heme-copper oxidase subunit III [Euryarchaeota archaeon]